jgi:hypothetical protein
MFTTPLDSYWIQFSFHRQEISPNIQKMNSIARRKPVLDFNCTPHIDQVTTQLGLVPRQCSLTFRIL